ncbi:lasso peptide biosynthesis B2 protein [Streptomyces sp. R35]|uniref:Lasso peptide biosynthesis B2 protein n=1 Tax=Streptomyces sp. R35 TaxID=3238630 RepID=A0AB39S0E8_9ACTN
MRNTAGIYAATGPEGVALMDLRTGRGQWRFLEPIGAELWRTITDGATPADAIEKLTCYWSSRGADPQQVRVDLTALVDELERADLLHSAPRTIQHERLEVRFAASVPASTTQSLAGHVGLFLAVVLLRLLPIRAAVAVAHAAVRLPGSPATPEEAQSAHAAVCRATRWWPGRAACLETSLGAYFAAAFTGHRVRWAVGARFTPQGAHAWIEAGHTIVGQNEMDRVWPYVPALQVAAG